MNLFRKYEDIDRTQYMLASYHITSRTNLRDAAWNIAIGQSVGNPNVRNEWESDELFEKHSCLILEDEKRLSATNNGMVLIAFPIVNTNFEMDGISHILCQLMGGHLDIDIIEKCSLIELTIPDHIQRKYFNVPQYGISGIRKFTGQYNKPLFGAIIKPKIGVSVDVLVDMTKQLVENGVDFIKEDEIMANPACCPLNERVRAISKYLNSQSRNVVFCHTVNADPLHLIDKVCSVYDNGGIGVHVNVYSGLGSYNSIRQIDLPLFIHFQKSGDRIFTSQEHKFNIRWPVICYLAGVMGVDTIQAGMIGGYSNDDEVELAVALKTLRHYGVLPALSCGMHPGLVSKVTSIVGVDYMANVGGAIHGHPGGTRSGAKGMRDAIDGIESKEYLQAIDKWGLVE